MYPWHFHARREPVISVQNPACFACIFFPSTCATSAYMAKQYSVAQMDQASIKQRNTDISFWHYGYSPSSANTPNALMIMIRRRGRNESISRRSEPPTVSSARNGDADDHVFSFHRGRQRNASKRLRRATFFFRKCKGGYPNKLNTLKA